MMNEYFARLRYLQLPLKFDCCHVSDNKLKDWVCQVHSPEPN